MQHRTKLGQALIQLATVVFFLNATFAYGACCVTIPSSGEATPQITEATSTTLPPCHQPNQQVSDAGLDQADNTPAAKDCCLMCVPMMSAPMLSNSNIQAAQAFSLPTFLTSFTGQLDPPFRPPISYQS